MQVSVAPGASAPVGQLTFGLVPPNSGSWTLTGSSVTLPVLVTLKPKVIVSPASAPLPSTSSISEEVLTRSTVAVRATGVLVVSLSVTLVPDGAVPVVVPVLSTLPASTSAWFSVYVAVEQVTEAPGASGPEGHVTLGLAPPNSGSCTVTGFRVTLPVFVTLKVYGILSPASGPLPSRSSIAPAVFFSRIAGKAATGVLVDEVSVTWTPLVPVPLAVAVLSTIPAFTSDWVRV